MYHRIRLLVLGGYALVALASIGGAIWVSTIERAALLGEGQRQTEGLALALGEFVGGVLKSADVLLQDLAEHIEAAGGPARIAPELLHAQLKRYAGRVSEVGAVVVYGADLEMRAVSLSPDARGAGGAGREDVQVHVARDLGRLFVGKTMLGPVSRSQLIPLSRRLNAPGGSFAGAIGASLPLETIERFFRRLGLEPGAELQLLRADGEVLLRLPPARGASPRLAAQFRHPELPVVVVLTRDTDALLAPWRRPLPVRATLLALLLAAAGTLAFVFLRRVKAQLRTEAQLSAVFRSSPVAHSILRTADSTFVDVNEAWERMHGISRERALGRTARELDLWEDTIRRDRVIAAIGREGAVRDLQARFRRPNGETFDALLSCGAVDLDGIAHRVFSVVDVSAQARANAALKQSEERFSKLFRSSPTPLVLTRLMDGQCLDLNEAAQALFGDPRVEVVGSNQAILAAWPDRAQREQYTRDLLAHGQVRDLEVRLRRKSGEPRECSIWAERIELDGVPCILAAILDMTERRRAESALQESEAFRRAVFNSFEASIAVLDAQGAIVAVNDAWQRFAMQNSADEATRSPIGRNYIAACEGGAPGPGDASADAACAGIRAVLGGARTRFDMEYTCHSPEEQRWYAMSVLALAGSRGGALVAHANITARKRAEQALRESEERFAKLFRSSPVAHSLLHGADGRYVDVNEAWERTFGYTRDEAVDRTSVELGVWMDPGEHAEFVQRPVAANGVRSERGRRRRRNGEVFEAIVAAEAIELGGARYRVTSTLDITAEARALEEVRRLNETLEVRVRERTAEFEESNRELEAFSYSVSHDLRAPLRAMTGFAEILLREHKRDLDADGARMLGRIGQSARKMGELIDALLEMGRLMRQPFARQRVDLGALAREVIAGLRERAPGRAVRVSIAPELATSADPALARSLLENLLGNAWKYTSKTKRARIEFVRQGEVFCVRDNGAGFDMRYAGKLFQPFERLHGEDEFAGTGIGLALAERIVRRHGGRIWAEGEPGRGAAFHFTLG